MNRKIIVGAVLAAFVGSMGGAMAQGRGNDDQRGKPDKHDKYDKHESRGNNKYKDKHADKYDDRRDFDGDRRNDRYDYGHDNRGANNGGHRGAGPRHDLYKGHRLPPQYRSKQYVVDNWRGHRLSAPPRGYHWVQTGADYVLVGIATGVIATLILSN